MNRIPFIPLVIALSITTLFAVAHAADEVQPVINRPFHNSGFQESADLTASRPTKDVEVAGGKVTYGISSVSHSGEQSVMVEVAPGTALSWYGFSQTVSPVKSGEIYQFSYWVKTDKAAGGIGAYAGIEFMDPNKADARLSTADSERFNGTNDWTLSKVNFKIPDGVNTIRINMNLHGSGRAYFDDTKLERIRSGGPLPDAKVSLKLTDQAIPGKFMGFGFEDDPFLLTDGNLKYNIGAEDLALRERRIKTLNPAIVRSFLWWYAFNPSKDLKTFDYESVGMKSVYRMLAIYQKMGVPVVITDTHWDWTKDEFPYSEKNVERGIEVYLKILEYLIRDRGFTCIRYATVINEPNYFWLDSGGGTRANYDKANKLFHARLMKSKIKGHLQLIGADSAMSASWLRDTILNGDESYGAYSYHGYLLGQQYPLMRELVQDFVGTVRDYSKPQGKKHGLKIYKPALLLEYGHLDKWENGNQADTMRRYEGALWTANANMEIINQGAAGAALWCLHSVYYSGQLMVPGLWDFKDRQWAIRPVYYAQGLFMQFARPGVTPLKLEFSADSYEFNASAIKDVKGRVTLFLVNLDQKPIEANLAGMPEGKYRAYELTQEKFAAVKSAPNAELMDCLAGDPVSIGKTHHLTMKPESLVVLRQIQRERQLSRWELK